MRERGNKKRKIEKERHKTEIPTTAAEGEGEANVSIWGCNSENRLISKVLQRNEFISP